MKNHNRINEEVNGVNDIAVARKLLDLEAEAIKKLSKQLDDNFLNATEILLKVRGRVIVTGM